MEKWGAVSSGFCEKKGEELMLHTLVANLSWLGATPYGFCILPMFSLFFDRSEWVVPMTSPFLLAMDAGAGIRFQSYFGLSLHSPNINIIPTYTVHTEPNRRNLLPALLCLSALSYNSFLSILYCCKSASEKLFWV